MGGVCGWLAENEVGLWQPWQKGRGGANVHPEASSGEAMESGGDTFGLYAATAALPSKGHQTPLFQNSSHIPSEGVWGP